MNEDEKMLLKTCDFLRNKTDEIIDAFINCEDLEKKRIHYKELIAIKRRIQIEINQINKMIE